MSKAASATEPRQIESPEPLFRHSAITANDVADDNTFQIAASSEYPVERTATKLYAELGIAKEGEKFLEVLSHEPGDVDLSRFNAPNKASFLDEHNDTRHLGPITKATLSDDKVVRIVASCDGISKLSKTRAKQIRSLSRPNVSIGYKHTRYLGPQTLDDGRVTHRFAWAALETSSVSVPADPNVGVGRSANKCHCFSCGGAFERSQLNRVDGAFMCPDCEDATTVDDADERKEKGNEKQTRAADEKFSAVMAAMKEHKARKADDFRFTRDKQDEISFGDLRNKVYAAADSDKRFKIKRPNGDLVSCFNVSDIVYDPDAEKWTAILYTCDYAADYCYSYFQVGFKIAKDGSIELGEAVAVQPVTEYQPVDRSEKKEGDKQTRSVDSQQVLDAASAANKPTTQNTMPKTIAELEAEAPQLVTEIRAATEKTVRAAVISEHNTRSKKIEEANKEVRALADEAVKLHGTKWNGEPGKVFVVGEAIRRLESEICAKDETHDAVERRTDFKRQLDGLITGARKALELQDAGTLEENLANRCSLRRLWTEAEKAFSRGDKRACFTLSDGAEHEAATELRNKAQHYPGGLGYEPGGQLFPSNLRTGVNSRMKRSADGRLMRDSLLGDFPSAGALVAPEYMTPIELLRNKMALAKANITVFSGVVGSPLTFPRLIAPTTGQSLAEGAAAAFYDQTFDQVKMTPHRIATAQKYSRLAMSQAPGFEALVWDDHMQVQALRADYLGLNGSGANDEPLGILNQPGINPVLFSGSAANAYTNIIAMETAIRNANIDEAPAYITTPAGRGTLRVTPAKLTGSTVVSGSTNALWVGETLAGRDAVDTRQVPNDILIALVGRHLMFASWAGMSVVLDTISLAEYDKFKLSINQYIDWGLRHPQAVSRSIDSVATLA